MQKKKLIKLANFLDTLEPERFYYGCWVGHNWDGRPKLTCGTTACAGGWATTIFRDLKLEFPSGKIIYQDKEGLDALASFFGISFAEARCLFIPSINVSGRIIPRDRTLPAAPPIDAGPRDVARHIRKFVEGK